MFEDKTLDEIADAWVKAKREIKAAEVVKDTAEPFLKAWFKANPEARDYKGLIGLSFGSRVIIDNALVKQQLGARIFAVQKSIDIESLSLLVP